MNNSDPDIFNKLNVSFQVQYEVIAFYQNKSEASAFLTLEIKHRCSKSSAKPWMSYVVKRIKSHNKDVLIMLQDIFNLSGYNITYNCFSFTCKHDNPLAGDIESYNIINNSIIQIVPSSNMKDFRHKFLIVAQNNFFNIQKTSSVKLEIAFEDVCTRE